MFRKTDKKCIEAYTNSDWVRSVTDENSTSGYCTFVWGNLITWRSKKLDAVTSSSAEVEYIAMSLIICERSGYRKLSDFHQNYELSMKLFCDNNVATSIANNSVQHERTKQVELDRHSIKEKLENDGICILCIPFNQQIVLSSPKSYYSRALTIVLASWI